VIFAGGLNGQKARMELMALLGAGFSVPEIRSWYENE
ncbi:MAG: hypothetical protein JWN30_1912, partial [Bacilli bacterium]|nr:hypothetical protein [Bacilli bacterium]